MYGSFPNGIRWGVPACVFYRGHSWAEAPRIMILSFIELENNTFEQNIKHEFEDLFFELPTRTRNIIHRSSAQSELAPAGRRAAAVWARSAGAWAVAALARRLRTTAMTMLSIFILMFLASIIDPSANLKPVFTR